MVEKYVANWSVLIITILKCVLVAWMYGYERFLTDIQSMIGYRSRAWVRFWSGMWSYVTPVTLICIILLNWLGHKPVLYGNYEYPVVYNAFGWFLGLLPVAVIIITAIREIINGPESMAFKERLRYLMRPNFVRGPADRVFY